MVKGELQSALADRYTIEHELGRDGMATSPIPSIASCSSPSGRSGTSPGVLFPSSPSRPPPARFPAI
jgi:hypothetical protein